MFRKLFNKIGLTESEFDKRLQKLPENLQKLGNSHELGFFTVLQNVKFHLEHNAPKDDIFEELERSEVGKIVKYVINAKDDFGYKSTKELVARINKMHDKMSLLLPIYKAPSRPSGGGVTYTAEKHLFDPFLKNKTEDNAKVVLGMFEETIKLAEKSPNELGSLPQNIANAVTAWFSKIFKVKLSAEQEDLIYKIDELCKGASLVEYKNTIQYLINKLDEAEKAAALRESNATIVSLLGAMQGNQASAPSSVAKASNLMGGPSRQPNAFGTRQEVKASLLPSRDISASWPPISF